MTILPERFIRFSIRDLKQDIDRLEGCAGEESRVAEYQEWVTALEAYYVEHNMGRDWNSEARDLIQSAQELQRRLIQDMFVEGEISQADLDKALAKEIIPTKEQIEGLVKYLKANDKG